VDQLVWTFWKRAVRIQLHISQLIHYTNYSILPNLKLIVTQTVKNLPTFYKLPILLLFFTVALLLKFKNSEGKYLYVLGEKQIEHHGGFL
jgi:hypothetical protein